MKKILLKIIIGIVAVPTIAIGTLYLTRDISVVSEYIVKPMAQLSQNLGIPVLIIPSDNYFKKEAREVYDRTVEHHNDNVQRVGDIVLDETASKAHYSEGVSIYQNYNAGVKYADLIVKPYEQFEKEWVEYSKEFYKNSKKPSKQDIENYNNNINDAKSNLEKQQQLLELDEQLHKAILDKNEEKAKQLQQQIDELNNQ